MARREFGNINRLPSGTYWARYVGPDLKRHLGPKTFPRKTDAEAWLARERRYWDDLAVSGRLAEWKTPRHRLQADLAALAAQTTIPTVEDYSGQYVVSSPLRPETLKSYNSLLRNHILPTFGAVRITEVTKEQVRGWWAGFGSTPPRQANKAYGLLHSIFARAVYDELIKENPVNVRGASKPSRRKGSDTLTRDEVQAIVEAMPERLAMAVQLAAWVGLRSGEVRALRRQDVEFLDADRAVIHVSRSVTTGEHGLVVGPPKTEAGVRDWGVPPPLVPALRSHIEAWAEAGAEGLLFSQVRGGPMSDTHLGKVVRRACEAAGTPLRRDGRPFTLHDLRAFALTQAGAAGATRRELQDMAGHTSAAMVDRYQRTDPGHYAEVVRRIGDRMETGR